MPEGIPDYTCMDRGPFNRCRSDTRVKRAKLRRNRPKGPTSSKTFTGQLDYGYQQIMAPGEDVD